MIFAIDPGHGMSNDPKQPGVYDPGACYGGFEEAKLVLLFAHALRRELQNRGATAVLTRENDVQATPYTARAGMARAAGAQALIVFHCNASTSAMATGTETFYLHSDMLARRVHAKVLQALGLRDRGCKLRDDLAVLKGFKGPTAYCELGFMSNPGDLAVLTRADSPRRVAAGIADALSVGL